VIVRRKRISCVVWKKLWEKLSSEKSSIIVSAQKMKSEISLDRFAQSLKLKKNI